MAVVLRWESLEEGIIYWGFEDYWTWGEYFDSIPKMIALASTSKHERIYILVDLRESLHIPVDLIQNVRRGSPKNEEEAKGWGLTVVVGGNAFVKTVYTLMCRLRPLLAQHYRLADTPEEAHAMIQEHRQSALN